MTKDVRYYRDIQPGETLQAGDEIYSGREWIPIAEQSIGVELSGRELLLFRRPVDLLVLQPVTPEAMAELERHNAATIVTCDHDSAWVYRWSKGMRWTANRLPATRPTWGWFIDLTTIPEVQQ